jgi:hypothetical protein
METQEMRHETVTIETAFQVERWDAEQVDWTRRKFTRGGGGWPDFEPEARHFRAFGVKPYSVTREENCNDLVQGGFVSLLFAWSASGTALAAKFSATNGRIGVGTSTAAIAWNQTFLVGDTGSASTTSYYALCGAGPTINTAAAPMTMVWSATFGTTVANFAWQEFGTDNAATAAVNLNGLAGGFTLVNRGLSNQGTKPNSQVWTATETMSFGFPTGSGTVGL